MFQTSFQSGPFFELFDVKNNRQKDRTIFRILNPNASSRTYDKIMKNHILEIEGANNKIVFPKDQKMELALFQQYLTIQILISSSTPFSLELTISDGNKVAYAFTKRRVVFSSSASKIEKKPFFIRLPVDQLQKQKWLNICIDLYSFILAFKGQNYRSLDAIALSGVFKLRKIFTTKSPLTENENLETDIKSNEFIPRNFGFPPGLPYSTQFIKYEGGASERPSEQEIKDEVSQSFQDSVQFKNHKHDFSTPKTEIFKHEKPQSNMSVQKRFLSNTNSEEMIMRLRKKEQSNKNNNTLSHATQNTNNIVMQNANMSKPEDRVASSKAKPPAQTKEDNKYNSNSNQTKPVAKRIAQLPQNRTLNSTQKHTRDSSVQQKRTKAKLPTPAKKDMNEITAKHNPWRSNKHKNQEEQHEVKEQIDLGDDSVDDRSGVKSAKTTLFKKPYKAKIQKKLEDFKINTNNRKSENYSDSEYFELSQKFSTLTDPKFFKPESISRMTSNNLNSTQIGSTQDTGYSASKRQEGDYDEEIEEAIETETNQSMRHSTVKKQTTKDEHASDEEDRVQQPPQPIQSFNHNVPTSKQGFLENHLKKFICEIQRPYTPPITLMDESKKTLHSEERESNQQGVYAAGNNENKEVELIYDPVLNCYYDFKTNTYYELKPS